MNADAMPTLDAARNRIGDEPPRAPVRALVMGMGIRMFGKERRMLRSLSRMTRIAPLFLLSSWDLGEVSSELEKSGMPYRKATLGYLGFVHPWWTLKNVFFMPILNCKVLWASHQHRAKVFLFGEVLSFFNALPAFVLLRTASEVRFVFYLGDIGGGTLIQRLLARLADRFADCVIVNSKAVKDGLRAAGWTQSRIHVVYNGVDHAVYRETDPVELRAFTDWPHDSFVVGFVGQLKSNKGIADFLAAARLVIKRVPTVRFLVIGDCSHRSSFGDELRQQFSDLGTNVCWLGKVSSVERYYGVMHAVVVASRHADPAPNVNLEAMASGLPLIATATGGTPELVDDNVTGFLVPPRRPEEICHRIVQLASDAELAKAMGDAGKRRSQQLFDLSNSAKSVESLIIGDTELSS